MDANLPVTRPQAAAAELMSHVLALAEAGVPLREGLFADGDGGGRGDAVSEARRLDAQLRGGAPLESLPDSSFRRGLILHRNGVPASRLIDDWTESVAARQLDAQRKGFAIRLIALSILIAGLTWLISITAIREFGRLFDELTISPPGWLKVVLGFGDMLWVLPTTLFVFLAVVLWFGPRTSRFRSPSDRVRRGPGHESLRAFCAMGTRQQLFRGLIILLLSGCAILYGGVVIGSLKSLLEQAAGGGLPATPHLQSGSPR